MGSEAGHGSFILSGMAQRAHKRCAWLKAGSKPPVRRDGAHPIPAIQSEGLRAGDPRFALSDEPTGVRPCHFPPSSQENT